MNYDNITWNGINLDSVTYNGVLVWQAPKLPSEYTKVEYIKSDQQAYLMIDFIGTLNSRIEATIEKNVSGDTYVIASRVDTSDTRFIVFAQSSQAYVGYGKYGYIIKNIPQNGEKFKLMADYKNMTYSINDSIVDIPQSDITNFTNTANLQIPFRCLGNTPSTIQSYGKSTITLYELKCFENDKLEINLIPCIRKEDNVIGAYDTVHKKFYSNIGGGSFTAGDPVN